MLSQTRRQPRRRKPGSDRRRHARAGVGELHVPPPGPEDGRGRFHDPPAQVLGEHEEGQPADHGGDTLGGDPELVEVGLELGGTAGHHRRARARLGQAGGERLEDLHRDDPGAGEAAEEFPGDDARARPQLDDDLPVGDGADLVGDRPGRGPGRSGRRPRSSASGGRFASGRAAYPSTESSDGSTRALGRDARLRRRPDRTQSPVFSRRGRRAADRCGLYVETMIGGRAAPSRRSSLGHPRPGRREKAATVLQLSGGHDTDRGPGMRAGRAR